jgi:hypothetical protein
VDAAIASPGTFAVGHTSPNNSESIQGYCLHTDC